MLTPSQSFLKQLEDLAAKIEISSDAEVVVVGRRESGSYRDVDLLAGSLVALVALLVLAPAASPLQVSFLTAIAYLVGFLASRRSPALRRRLCLANRRAAQAWREARIAFVEQGVSRTRRRTGVLFFYSIFEDELVVLPDLGIADRVPSSDWARVRHVFDAARGAAPESARVLDALEAVGVVLTTQVPAIPGDNPDELSNAPRFGED